MTSSALSLHRCAWGCRVSPSGNPHGLSLLGTGLELILPCEKSHDDGLNESTGEITFEINSPQNIPQKFQMNAEICIEQ